MPRPPNPYMLPPSSWRCCKSDQKISHINKNLLFACKICKHKRCPDCAPRPHLYDSDGDNSDTEPDEPVYPKISARTRRKFNKPNEFEANCTHLGIKATGEDHFVALGREIKEAAKRGRKADETMDQFIERYMKDKLDKERLEKLDASTQKPNRLEPKNRSVSDEMKELAVQTAKLTMNSDITAELDKLTQETEKLDVAGEDLDESEENAKME